MNINLVKVDKAEAYRQYRLYAHLPKQSQDEDSLILKKAYWHAKAGKPILDVYAAFQQTGLNADGLPRLGIAPALSNRVDLRLFDSGRAVFGGDSQRAGFSLPDGTFQWARWKTALAGVPTVPAIIRAKLRGKLARHHWILWEVEKWDAPANDPYLLLRLSRNLFVVIAEWNLTPLEQALLRGKA